MFLDTQIRSSLGLDQANADECLEAMDQVLEIQLTPLMLKKHSHIVETIKRVGTAIGVKIKKSLLVIRNFLS
jgi:hypothetical protein